MSIYVRDDYKNFIVPDFGQKSGFFKVFLFGLSDITKTRSILQMVSLIF